MVLVRGGKAYVQRRRGFVLHTHGAIIWREMCNPTKKSTAVSYTRLAFFLQLELPKRCMALIEVGVHLFIIGIKCVMHVVPWFGDEDARSGASLSSDPCLRLTDTSVWHVRIERPLPATDRYVCLYKLTQSVFTQCFLRTQNSHAELLLRSIIF